MECQPVAKLVPCIRSWHFLNQDNCCKKVFIYIKFISCLLTAPICVYKDSSSSWFQLPALRGKLSRLCVVPEGIGLFLGRRYGESGPAEAAGAGHVPLWLL